MPFIIEQWNGHEHESENWVVACFDTLEKAVKWCGEQDPRCMYNSKISILEAFYIYEFVGSTRFESYYADGTVRRRLM